MQNEERLFSKSDININDRSSIDISGVEEILSYDENSIVLSVCGERLIIEGEALRVNELCTKDGRVSAAGKICSLTYEEGSVRKGGFFSSLFKG